jgi:hypothetical protein
MNQYTTIEVLMQTMFSSAIPTEELQAVQSLVLSSWNENHANEHVRGTGQGEARHRRHKRLKLGGG